MIRPVIHDPEFLSIPSVPATKDDISVADDLLDTLRANTDKCVGMAANMIGVSKNIIVFQDGSKYVEMFNPRIVRRIGSYETEEGCLSLSGTRKTTRYKTIKVEYETRKFETKLKLFTDWTAQIIQHEIDHLSGILI